MIDFAFFLKTYSADYDRVGRLISSFHRYNEDDIHLFLACPEDEKSVFDVFSGEDVTVLSEESICLDVFQEDSNFSKGYLNQEIYKISFWELALCKNYMCIDSDALFIRPFYVHDFMYDSEIPYTILVEDNDLCADRYYNRQYWNGRREQLRKIQEELDFRPQHMLTCHGFQIFSSVVLCSFKNDFMEKKNYTYKDIIGIAPYEFSWYNFWLQKSCAIPIHVIEPLFKTIHLKQHHINYLLSGMKLDDWAKAYIGVVVNSNYGIGDGKYDDLKVYNYTNSDITDDVIDLNYRFYKKLRYERVITKVCRLLERIVRRLMR
ncbi:MAG: hypothetical protein J6X48_05570 [Lachnospiraceae bacterium]|nr:hypothetical protein [Lachnospiraceae bacterium]